MSAEDIDRLIEKYGQAAFDLAMRQVWIDLVFVVIGAVIATAIAGVLLGSAWRSYGKWRAATDSYSTHDIDTVGLGMFGGLVAGLSLLLWNAVISTLLNPAWVALQKLIP